MSRSARIAWGFAGLVALLAGAIGAYFSTRPPVESPPAPVDREFLFRTHATPPRVADLAFEDGGGRKRSLSEFRGKVVLLNVWATWCAPCREEMPALERLQQKLGGPRFEVVALSIDPGGAAAVKRFYGELGLRALPVYVDSEIRAMHSLGLVGIPSTLLIDRQGREVGRRTGPAEWDGPEAVRMITAQMQ